MDHRAYSCLEIKAASDTGGRRTFKGIATTPETDRTGDIVEPKGAQFKLPIPLLWQHDSGDPIGWITSAKVTSSGIEIEGEVASYPDDPEGDLAKRLTKAWQMMKSGLVKGLSIGFRGVETARIEPGYGMRFIKWLWLELSAVTIPANGQATITAIKSADAALLSASGMQQRSAGRPGAQPPGVSGHRNISQNGKGFTMKTLQEQLQEMQEARATKAARLQEISDAVKAEQGRKFTDAERDEFDLLSEEIDQLDDQIRTKRLESINAKAASPVSGGNSGDGTRSRVAGGMNFVRREDPEDSFKGQSFVRGAIAKAASFIALKEGNYINAGDWAAHRWGKTHPKLVAWVKAAVAGAGTGSGEWGAELAQSNTRFTGDFVEFLYGMTVFDRLPLTEVPHNIHVSGQDGAASAFWVGESKAIGVTKADASDVELRGLKVGAIAIASKEFVADASPSGELFIRNAIGEASAQRVDTTFFSANAAVSGVSPAGILNGLSALAPSGADAAAIRADLMALYLPFLAAKNASGLVQVMNPSMAKAISLLVNALGQKEFPGLKSTGGELEGDMVYTGDNIAGGDWILMKPKDIWKIGDSGIQMSMTDTATVEQDDSPTGASDTPSAATTTQVNLWQSDSVGFKVTRRINFAKRRSGAVVYLANGEYGGVAS